MAQIHESKAFSLRDVLSNDTYIIPIYQRSYAWEKAEISQLINDVIEFFEIGKTTEYDRSKSYYLGSLVCFKRQDGSFELIDGQQRHTTITLINLVLKNWESLKIENPVSSSNLRFDSRKNAQRFIEKLYSTHEFSEKLMENHAGVDNFKTALNIIEEELHGRNIELFAQCFYDNVKLFRVEVPHDTDMNHYFEIMNNRGEQLEKHEIVKALLMGEIDNDDQKNSFAIIWDACSDMNDYVYFNFANENNNTFFAQNGDLLQNSIAVNPKTSARAETLSDILERESGHSFDLKFEQSELIIRAKYRSIIDFPNFLLQVLKIKNDSVSLDDKKLLEHFDKSIDPNEFIYDLLRSRILFDKHIIKQDLSDANENKQNWGIRSLNKDGDDIIKTFEDDEELVKLQTMLYYSNPSNTNNHWLQTILKKKDFSIDDYTEHAFQIAQARFDPKYLSYPEISIFNLYFIDFLLWKLYKQNKTNVNEALMVLKGKIDKNREPFSKFRFRQLSSKEHLLPQARAKEDEKEILNSLGNLCLISVSQNSEGNKEHPIYKRDRFANDNSSLKRLIMFESFNDKEWGKAEIEDHEKEIKELISWISNKQ